MREMTCAEVQDAAPEYALDIMESQERAVLAAHLIRCADCRRDVQAMQESANRLLDIVPGTEPAPGFGPPTMDRLDRSRRPAGRRFDMAPGPARRRFRTVATLAAAALMIVGSTFGAEAGRSGAAARPVLAAAQFLSGGTVVGEVYIYSGQPPRLEMAVHGLSEPGKISCVVVSDTGGTTVGSFQLDHGSAYWDAPVKSGGNGVTGVQLQDAAGHVLASASF